MRYLLDTNVCIEILRGRNPVLKARLTAEKFEELSLCSIVWAELRCGAYLARDSKRELARLQAAFGHWTRLPFDDASAECYGEIRAHLKHTGNLIGANDLLIAAIAKANNLVLISHNVKEFARVPGLTVEDWQVSE